MFYDFETNKQLSISSQYFSGTDKCKDPKEPGVVFPLACNDSVKDMLNVSSVIDHHNSEIALCKYTEARIANANVEKNEVEYVETKILSLEYNLEESYLDSLLEKESKFIYQCDNKITPLLKDKLTNVINALYSNDMPFESIMMIDKSNIDVKEYSFAKFDSMSYDGPTLFPVDTSDKVQKELIDTIVFEFDAYMKSLSGTEQNKVINFALERYYGNPANIDIKSILTDKVWGKEIDKVRKNKDFKDYFKNNVFLGQLCEAIIDVIHNYDLGLEDDRNLTI